MSILPVRDLGSVGVITDAAPYNIPINAFSTGINVRFDEGKVRRAPIFRKVKDSLGFTPRHCFRRRPATGYDTVVMVSDDYAIHEYASRYGDEPIWFHHRLFRPPAIHDHPAGRCRLHKQTRQGSGVPWSSRD